MRDSAPTDFPVWLNSGIDETGGVPPAEGGLIGEGRNCCSRKEGPLEWSNRRFGAKSAQICGKKVTLDQKPEKRAKFLRSGQKLCVAGMNRGRKWVPPMRLHTLHIIAYTFRASKCTPSPSKNSLRAQKTTFPANSPRGGGGTDAQNKDISGKHSSSTTNHRLCMDTLRALLHRLFGHLPL